MINPLNFLSRNKQAVALVPKKQSITEIFADRYNIESGKVLEILAATAFKPSGNSRYPTLEEITALLIIANQYGLNPFIKEIYAFEKNGAIEAIVPIDGWITMCNKHPQYNGMKFAHNRDGNGNLVSITCWIYRKDRDHPTEVTEELAECKKETGPWKKWPVRMLRHKAVIQCARYAFGLSGIYDPDEADRIMESETEHREVLPVTEQAGLPAYPDDRFAEMLPGWVSAIQAGKKSASDMVSTIQSKYTLSETQVQQILDAEAVEGEIVQSEPDGVHCIECHDILNTDGACDNCGAQQQRRNTNEAS